MNALSYLVILVLIYTTLKYKRRSERDLFTNVYHKQFLLGGNGVGNKLIQHMKKARKNYKNSFGMFFIDLDKFKYINDVQGHDVGDKILLKVVKVLRNNTRQGPFFHVSKGKNSLGCHFVSMVLGFFDVLRLDYRRVKEFGFDCFKYDWIIRYGGDEFLIIIKNIRDKEALKDIAERILSSFREEIKITASIGGSIFTNKEEINEEKFMKKLDDAMYEAKDAGRDCVRIV